MEGENSKKKNQNEDDADDTRYRMEVMYRDCSSSGSLAIFGGENFASTFSQQQQQREEQQSSPHIGCALAPEGLRIQPQQQTAELPIHHTEKVLLTPAEKTLDCADVNVGFSDGVGDDLSSYFDSSNNSNKSKRQQR